MTIVILIALAVALGFAVIALLATHRDAGDSPAAFLLIATTAVLVLAVALRRPLMGRHAGRWAS